ncbi:Arylsulfatase [Planctomycetes bacterium Poly30]|uniref:Arylsulfatase n=1 Tax=Saltatorellus ferox TaxID=2528018 RepID=A0A518F056_9BACT|nr:Arylsulfatase [Planctomycetes bacterium Poly30]
MVRTFSFLFFWALLTRGALALPEDHPRVLLIILDDVGVDALGCYAAGSEESEPAGEPEGPTVRTPEMDRLAAQGVRFDSVWSCPACSPTRATILTGHYGFRTGIGSVILPRNQDPGLAAHHRTLPRHLASALPAVKSAMLGKWHLSGHGDGPDHPRELGFDHFRGTSGNLGGVNAHSTYFEFEGTQDGEPERRAVYATTAVTDDAIAAMERWEDSPWLIVASYHAAHEPLHRPPADLVSEATAKEAATAGRPAFLAMVEAMDHEIGRLVRAIPEESSANTLVLIVGDNGTESAVSPGGRSSRASGKGTLLESGLRVPMIAMGAGVAQPGRSCTHLVNTTDLFSTVTEWMLGAAPAAPGDSVSFAPYLRAADAAPQRAWVFAERFERTSNGRASMTIDRVAVRGPRFKLIEDRAKGTLRFFDLASDPNERVNLLRAGKMDADAIEAMAAFTVFFAGPFGAERRRALQ